MKEKRVHISELKPGDVILPMRCSYDTLPLEHSDHIQTLPLKTQWLIVSITLVSESGFNTANITVLETNGNRCDCILEYAVPFFEMGFIHSQPVSQQESLGFVTLLDV